MPGTPAFWRDSDDLQFPTLFPANLAGVHPTWRAALQLVSNFWSRTVVFVDEGPYPVRVLRDQLTRSNNETHVIHILRRPRGTDAHPEGKTRVAGIMMLILPNISRANCMHTDAVYLSPLPPINLVGYLSLLTGLRVQFAVVAPPSPRSLQLAHLDALNRDAFWEAYGLDRPAPATIGSLTVAVYQSI